MTNNFVEKIKSILPSKKNITLRNEIDCYGISHMISDALNLPFTPWGVGNWIHGWLHADLKYIEQFGCLSNLKYLVITDEQKVFFEKHNKAAFAVGAPYIYAEDYDLLDIVREPNTLLVMPPHGLSFSAERWDEEAYVKQISGLKNSFYQIVACLHSSCIDKNKWSEMFDEYDIPWIEGADMHDKYALVRLHRIFSSFEYMTTNAIGSHVAYAAYSGCKVSIFGDFAEWKEEYIRDDELYMEYPYVMHHNLNNSSKEFVAKKFSFLFSHPLSSLKHVQWASKELGRENKKSYFRLAILLGWLPHQQLYFWCCKVVLKIKKGIDSYLK